MGINTGTETRFFSPTKGPVTFHEMIEDVVSIMQQDTDYAYEVIVGTDSHPSRGDIDFVTAIIVRRVGKGGRYFWSRSCEGQYHDLSHRIYREAILSFDWAKAIMESLEKYTMLDFNLEIHVDVGRNGKTRSLIDGVVGMIVGGGFPVKIKPDAYAASSVADKYT
jgi:hypothetical protein